MSNNSTDQQAATKADLKAFAEQIVTQLRGEMKAQGESIVTQLRGEMKDQGEAIVSQLRGEIQSVEKGLRSEMDAQEEKIVVRICDKLDSKLAATTYELKRHTEDTVAAHSSEVLDAIASVVEPLQTKVNRHAVLLDDLAARVA